MNFKIEDSEDKSLIATRARVRREEIQYQLKQLVEGVSNTLLSLLIVLMLWVVALWAFDVTPYIGKGPLEVFEFLFLDEEALENQMLVGQALGQTLVDASIGFSFGLLFATIVAVIFTLSKGLEQALMPIAMLLRSVPLIANTCTPSGNTLLRIRTM